MGNFTGHAVPGTFFFFFGAWWTLCQFIHYHQSRLKNGKPYKNRATFKFFCMFGRLKELELEGALKIFFAIIGICGEIITGFHMGQFTALGNGQHATMFFFFGTSGVIDILIRHGFPMPRSLSYISFNLALIVELVLFKFHLHGRSDLDVVVHTLLIYVIIMNIIAVFAEMKFQENILAGLARSYFILIQGTWFWQVGYMLYNPIPGGHPWEGENHENILIATMVFTWHLGAVFLLQMVIGGIVACIYRSPTQFNNNTKYELLDRELNCKEAHDHILQIDLDPDGNDTDFESQYL